VVLTLGALDHTHEAAFERIDTVFLVFFLLEIIVRLRRAGWRWLRQPWNLLDTTIILLALLPVLGDGITVLRIARLCRLINLGRHVSHFKERLDMRVW